MSHRTWGTKSKRVLATLDPRLKVLVTRVRDEVADISLTAGYRGKRQQNNLYDLKLTKVKWPNSKHNRFPSVAVDIRPYPYPSRTERVWSALGYIAGAASRIALEEGFEVRWGGDWNGNGDVTDQAFDDLFHLEIKEHE